MAFPSARVIDTVGIVIVGSEPDIPGGELDDTLSAMITPTAPASCAFFAFTTKAQGLPVGPRSIRAIFPDTAAPIAEQPSAGEACATFAVTPPEVRAGPNVAVP